MWRMAIALVVLVVSTGHAQHRGLTIEPQDQARVALVIGNSAYQREQDVLPNPANDAKDMAEKLDDFGFRVIVGVDHDYRGMRMALRDFDRALQGADVGLFYYAGHGMEYQGRNYLFPTDVVLETEGDVGIGLIDLAQILHVMETAVPTRLVFLDACRNNPLAQRFRSTLGASRSTYVGRGLARVDASVGTFIAYATAPGEIAADGTGRNSPFTGAMLAHLDEPGLDVEPFMRRVRNTVLEATDERQLPWNSSSLRGPFVFNPARGLEIGTGPGSESQSTPLPTRPLNEAETDADILWQALEGSDDAGEWRYFADRFPDDPRAELALIRAGVLQPQNADEQTASVSQELSDERVRPISPFASEHSSRAVEFSLALSREDWREIQASLEALGFDPQGSDGIPDDDTRTAIKRWQDDQGIDPTGFLDRNAVTQILGDAAASPTAKAGSKPATAGFVE